jgi:hypothetical protein
MKFKYVVGIIGGRKAAIVFPEYVVHVEAAACFSGRASGAGFFYVTDDEVIPYGESVSLHLKSNPEDARLIGEAIGHPAYYS